MRSQIHDRGRGVLLVNSSMWLHLDMDRLNFTHGSNETTLVEPSQQGSLETRIVLPIFMFAGGAVGNIIAIIVLSVSRQERKSSAFFTLVCGLAVTDLLGTCLASPITIANYYLGSKVLQQPQACAFHSFLLLFFSLTGLSIICTMAAERYLAICCPYTYQRWRVDRRSAQRFLLSIYLSHMLFCSLPMMGLSHSQLQPSNTWCFVDWKSSYSVVYGSASLLLILGTILLNLAVCGTLLLMRRRTVTRSGCRGSVRDRWRALSSAAETQMIAVLVTTSVVVLACSAPLVVSQPGVLNVKIHSTCSNHFPNI